MNPRLYSLSTVCLLKHYNQNYLFHSLRTDFTGSNGVGKSIIADLFQIVFVADTRYIKFATEGIDKKGRKIEKLPYNSGIGYVFFNVEVTEGNFIAIGAAIFSQGHQIVKPFVVTTSIDLMKDKLEQQTFAADRLLFYSDFLKPNKEPYTLEELARRFPDERNLFIHYFNTRDDRPEYYNWLYQNGLLPINLVKEGNLKAFAKVIQSFSKSKSLDIDSSNSLIEYLFEEDELEINKEYGYQQETIRKLLHQFKTTKEQIRDISSKQNDLRKLQQYDAEKRDAEYKLDLALILESKREMLGKQKEFDKVSNELNVNKNRLNALRSKAERFSGLVQKVTTAERIERNVVSDLAQMQPMFNRLGELIDQESMLRDIDIDGLIQEFPDNTTELLEKEAKYYEEKINGSRAVLQRFDSIRSMEKKKEEQLAWVWASIRDIEENQKQLESFRGLFQGDDKNSLFLNVLSSSAPLTEAQQAVLVYLRDVLLERPEMAKAGLRYTVSNHLIHELEITEDPANNGWWIKTGPLNEFVPKTASLIPDIAEISFDNLGELKARVDGRLEELKRKKKMYSQLPNGVLPEGFSQCEFDPDLSDQTKLERHTHAAHLCALVSEKINDLKVQKRKQSQEIQNAKQRHNINDEELEYQTLLDKAKKRSEVVRSRSERFEKQYSAEQAEVTGIEKAIPLMEGNFARLSEELSAIRSKFAEQQKSYEDRYPDIPFPQEGSAVLVAMKSNTELQEQFAHVAAIYTNEYNQITAKYDETKEQRDIRVNEQISNRNYSFTILEQALLGKKIRTLDDITGHLGTLNVELLAIVDELFNSLVKVFGKTEKYFDRYKDLVSSVNDFFRGKLISNRFYFRIDFDLAPKLDIKWIEHLRKSAHSMATSKVSEDHSPDKFIEDFYMVFSGNKRVSIDDLLNPKRYFVLKGKLTDESNKEIPGSTGESYTAIALLGIARLSIVQDGNRPGLRFMILEESATLDNVNFGMFPVIAERYGYQIITMTPKPYSIGGDEGWYIHQLIPGKANKDINYPKVMSYFRTNKSQIDLDNYLTSCK